MLRAPAVLALISALAYGSWAQAAPANAAEPAAPGGAAGEQSEPNENDASEAAGADKGTPAPDEAAAPASTGGQDDDGAPSTAAAGGTGEGDAAAEGEGTGEGAADAEADSNLHGLTCLEGDATGGRRKGVQRRDFLKKHRFELAAVGGFYASDALSSTYAYGGALAYYPSEDFGVELLVTRSPVRFRLEEPFNAFDRERHFPPATAWQWIASLMWSPIHAKFRFSDKNIVHGDIFAVAGAGRTMHESVLGLTWEAGAGLKLYLSRFVTFRFDVRDFLLPQEVLGRGRITNNVTILAGISLWLG